MNERWGLTAENMLHALPDVLKNDSGTAALASCTAAVLAERKAEIDSLILYARMDELPEPLLDLLAQDFKVDWWDGDYSLEEKDRLSGTAGTFTGLLERKQLWKPLFPPFIPIRK